jgi:hypothetical protein
MKQSTPFNLALFSLIVLSIMMYDAITNNVSDYLHTIQFPIVIIVEK